MVLIVVVNLMIVLLHHPQCGPRAATSSRSPCEPDSALGGSSSGLGPYIRGSRGVVGTALGVVVPDPSGLSFGAKGFG
eukprot:12045131-Karenia_brevis.AAC.1